MTEAGVRNHVLERALLLIITLGGAVAGATVMNLMFPSDARYPVGLVALGAGLWQALAAQRNATRYVAGRMPLWRSFAVAVDIRVLRLMGAILALGGIIRLLH